MVSRGEKFSQNHYEDSYVLTVSKPCARADNDLTPTISSRDKLVINVDGGTREE